MNLNRDEFLLLSRTGRGLHSTRAGPSPDGPDGISGRRLFRRRKTSALTVAQGAASGSRQLGPRMRGSQRPSRTRGYMDERAYHELEFLVGFPAEEESLL